MTIFDLKRVPAVLGLGLLLLSPGSIIGDTAMAQEDDSAISLEDSKIIQKFGFLDQADTQEPNSLQSHIALALSSNQQLASAIAEVDRSYSRVDQASTLPDPYFRFTHFIQSVETKVGPQVRAYSLSQSFPWFGSLSMRGEVMEEASLVTLSMLDQAILEVVTEVKSAYHELVYIEAAIEVTKQHLDLLSQWEDVARARYASGAGKYTDTIKAQVELGVLQDRLIELEDRRAPLIASLNSLLNQPPDSDITWETDSTPAIVEVDMAALGNLLNRDNPKLRSFDHQAEKFHKEARLAGKDGLPSFTLGLNLIETASLPVDGLEDNGKNALTASIGVKLPLWRGKYKAATQEAESGYKAARHGRQEELNRLISDLSQAAFRYRDAARKHSLYRDTLLPKGRQSLGAIQASYEAGESSFLDLVDAQRVLIEFELAQVRASADLQIQQAIIERLVANPIGE